MSPEALSSIARRAPQSVELEPFPPNHGPRNVLLIHLDDIGQEQLASYEDVNEWAAGYAYAPTPNIDALVARGRRFTRYYASPICTPTRVELMTGLYPHRTGLAIVITQAGASWVLSDITNESTGLGIRCWPRILRDPSLGLNYLTRHAGKWHLGNGNGDPLSPTRDAFFHRYRGCLTNLSVSDSGITNTGYGADGSTQFTEYDSVTSTYTVQTAVYNPVREADTIAEWLSDGIEPTVVSWWLHSVHTPDHWAPSSLHSYGAEPGLYSRLDSYRTMTEAMDTAIGQVLNALGPALDRTLVILCTDNGTGGVMVDADSPEHDDGTAPPDVYNPDHFKSEVYEGGVRCPLVVAGPGVQPGRDDRLVSVVDLMPTILDYVSAGGDWQSLVQGTDIDGNAVTFDNLDGKTLVAALAGDEGPVRDFVLAMKYGTEGKSITDPSVDRGRIACLSNTSGYKLILSKESAAGVWTEEFYFLGTDILDLDDPHEASPLDPNDHPIEYGELRQHIIDETSVSWTSGIT